jgi:hypothetical protein
MRFERELKPYADYVRSEDLREESVYFYVTFIDHEGLIPMLQPVVYIGNNLEPGDTGTVYFQDAGSFLAGVRLSQLNENDEEIRAVVYSFPSESGHVLKYDQALDVLLFCSTKRGEMSPMSSA